MNMDLLLLFSKLSKYIFNGYSNNKFYYFLPISLFFTYELSKEDQALLRKEGIEFNSIIRGFYGYYILLRSINDKLGIYINNADMSSISINDCNEQVFSAEIAKIKNVFLRMGGDNFFKYVIHGSFADQTNTSISDIDDIFIINKNVYSDFYLFKKALKISLKINTMYQRIDFTQHHGHWIFTYADLYFYNNYIMPTSVFEDNINMNNYNYSLYYNIFNGYEFDFREIFIITIDNIKKDLSLYKKKRINVFNFKRLISGVSLLVPLTFQILGRVYSKKNAILKMNEMYMDESIESVLWANNMRNSVGFGWRFIFYKKINLLLSLFLVNRNLLERISFYFSPKLKEIAYHDFYRNIKNIETLISDSYEIVRRHK